MAVTVMPINQVTVPARQNRQAFAALMMPGPGPLRTRSGFRPGGEPTVTVSAATWTVGPFSAVVDTGQSSVTGPYLVASDATETGAMTPADATYARKDILYLQLDDGPDEDSSGQRRGRVLPLTGVASATPAVPDTPARSLLVGTIDVPKDGNGAPVFTPSRLTTVAAGGILTVPSKQDLDAITNPINGMVAWVDGPGEEQLYVRALGAWRRVDWNTPWGVIGGKRYQTAGNIATGLAGTEVLTGYDTGPVTLLPGRQYKFSHKFLYISSGNTSSYWYFQLKKGGPSGGLWVDYVFESKQNAYAMSTEYTVEPPAVGAAITDTWYVTSTRLSGPDTLTLRTGGPGSPFHLIVEDQGPSSRLTNA